jgi:hypothetical protein
MSLEVCRVARQLANGAMQAPKGATAIFTRTTGDTVPSADFGAQLHGKQEAIQSKGQADVATNIDPNKTDDDLQNADQNSKSKENFEG